MVTRMKAVWGSDVRGSSPKGQSNSTSQNGIQCMELVGKVGQEGGEGAGGGNRKWPHACQTMAEL